MRNQLVQDEEFSAPTSGIRDLWAAVLHQAIDDSSKESDSRDREAARRWIQDGGMFLIICNYLEIDPDAARERIVAKWGCVRTYKHAKKTYTAGGRRGRPKKSR